VSKPIRRWGIALIGTVVLALGIVLIPYPGPGWLIVFAGLGILASEFEWARRTLHWFRARYDSWNDWLSRQHWSVRVLTFVATTLLVLVTLWLVGALSTIADWLGFEDWTWVKSPFA